MRQLDHLNKWFGPGYCSGKDTCPNCTIYKNNRGSCPGCNDHYYELCNHRSCSVNCSKCNATRNAVTQGCCSHSPDSWRDIWEKILMTPVRNYSPDPIEFNCAVIPRINHEIREQKIPSYFPDISAWVTTIKDVCSKQLLFKSSDLKDYLGISNEQKLILSTVVPDDYLEVMWNRRDSISFSDYNIDYWFPAHFSVYDDDNMFLQFANAKRQMLHAIRIKSQFTWYTPGVNIPLEFLEPIKNSPNILISTGQCRSKHNKEILRKEIVQAESWFPETSSFFIIGGKRDLPFSDSRKCYVTNSNWFFRGKNRKNLKREIVDGMSKQEILIQNLKEVIKNEG